MLDCWTCVPGPAAYEETGPSSWPGIATEGREAAMVSALEGKRKMDGGPAGFGIFLPEALAGSEVGFPATRSTYKGRGMNVIMKL